MRGPAISVAVSRPDGTSFRVVRGHAVIEHSLPADTETRFNVGSVAKQITAHLVIESARQLKLDLTAPVRCLIPRFAIDDVAVAELITHTSGIRDAEAMLSLCGYRELDHYTAADLLSLAYCQRQRCTPPGQFLYSNTNYLLLAAILESVHHVPFAKLAESHVFKPLGMTASAFRSDPRMPVPHAASSYETDRASFISGQRPVAIAGPGSLWTTPSDLLAWLRHLGSAVAPRWPTTLPCTSEIIYADCDQGHTYGPGLFATTARRRAALFHNGHEHGYSASTYLRDDNLAIACASNADWMAADRVMADLIRTGCALEDVEAVVSDHAARLPQRGLSQEPSEAELPFEDFGRYRSRELPGSIRLGRHLNGLSITRRGTVDSLYPDPTRPQSFRGHGMSITLAGSGKLPPDDFILDLDRAPGIRYTRHEG